MIPGAPHNYFPVFLSPILSTGTQKLSLERAHLFITRKEDGKVWTQETNEIQDATELNCISNPALLQHLPRIYFYAKGTACGTEISDK